MATSAAEISADAPLEAPSPLERGLPHSLALLCLAGREPSWTNLTLQLDGRGCRETRFRWVSTVKEMLAALREESYDCLIIADGDLGRDEPPDEHPPIDGFDALHAVRAGGYADPAILLTTEMSDERWMAALRLHSTVLTTSQGWESRALVPFIGNELQRSELKRANYRLSLAQQRRLTRERDETEYLLDQQRQILEELHGLVNFREQEAAVAAKDDDRDDETSPSDSAPDVLASEEVCRFYDELLRTYVMMGSGRLGLEITRLANLLAAASAAPRDVLAMHLTRVENMVRGLGSRSSRHVLSRADLLALELVIQLGECYRRGTA